MVDKALVIVVFGTVACVPPEAGKPAARDSGLQADSAPTLTTDSEPTTSESTPPYDDGTDTDDDGLTDVEEAALSTDPGAVDTDGDGLSDGLEVLGGDGLDPGQIPVSPLHADLLVEVDWMEADDHTHYFVDEAVQINVAAFAASPRMNPDGTTGIRLHVDRGQWGGGNVIAHASRTNPATFAEVRSANFGAARHGIFHHAMFIHTYDSSGSSGVADFVGDNLIVSLGYWFDQGEVPTDQAGTFMHELGHNLGLDHGGGDGINNKPNYPSVMNYAWQTTGLDGSAFLTTAGDYDYSYGLEPDVNEADLGFDVDGDRRLTSTIHDHDDWSAVILDWAAVPGHMLVSREIRCGPPLGLR